LVEIPEISRGIADNFIDDIISCIVDEKDHLKRIIVAPCTVIHTIAHMSSSKRTIPRQNIIADDKNKAEGAPEEVKNCVEWTIDSRRLLVSLPSHKFIAWTSQINRTIEQKSFSDKDLRSILGCLENEMR
jgi:hypothetical protein